MRAKQLVLAGLLAVTVVTTACGDDGIPAAQATEVRQLDTIDVPDTLLDLAVKEEDVSVVENTKRPFVEAVGLYSLRRDELLHATLQISRFTDEADATSPKFRRSVVTQIGSTTPRIVRVGDRAVYLTTGRRQSVAVWWDDSYLFVLSSREDYETPRALLRAALEIEP